MECYASCPAFITIKGHKPNSRNNTKYRLINPAKNKLGLVSKKHLEEIIGNVANTIKVNQWRNTATVIDWFKLLPQKDKSSFVKFDIVEFYPSISEELLNRSISIDRSITTSSDSVINIIHHSRKSLLFDRISVWVKKGNVEKVCHFFWVHLLHILCMYIYNTAKQFKWFDVVSSSILDGDIFF